jgi:hypothetical protein
MHLDMKKVFLMIVLMLGCILSINGKSWKSNVGDKSETCFYTTSAKASLTIQNRSSYSMIVKIMKTNGRGLYQIVTIGPQSSSTVYFSRSDTFFTKSKATKGMETIYKKTSPFTIQCDETGYSQATLQFFVSSGSGGTGQSISKAEFEKDN